VSGKMISIRVTDAEYDATKSAANKRGKSLASYARWCISKVPKLEADKDELIDALGRACDHDWAPLCDDERQIGLACKRCRLTATYPRGDA